MGKDLEKALVRIGLIVVAVLVTLTITEWSEYKFWLTGVWSVLAMGLWATVGSQPNCYDVMLNGLRKNK